MCLSVQLSFAGQIHSFYIHVIPMRVDLHRRLGEAGGHVVVLGVHVTRHDTLTTRTVLKLF